MRASIVLSLALSTAVMASPAPLVPSSGSYGSSGGGYSSSSRSTPSYGYNGQVPGAATSGLGAQRMSTSNRAQNYADNPPAGTTQPQAQAQLQRAQDATQQVMQQNPTIPQATVRAGVHSGGSTGKDMATVQMPAQPGQYQPPARPQDQGLSGAGSVAAHLPVKTGPGGEGQLDNTRPIQTLPAAGAGNVANKDSGNTASYNPARPYPYYGDGGQYQKRDLALTPEILLRAEILRRGIAMSQILGY